MRDVRRRTGYACVWRICPVACTAWLRETIKAGTAAVAKFSLKGCITRIWAAASAIR